MELMARMPMHVLTRYARGREPERLRLFFAAAH